MIRALIFDFNGILADDDPIHMQDTPARLREAHPDWIIDSIADFGSWLEKEISK